MDLLGKLDHLVCGILLDVVLHNSKVLKSYIPACADYGSMSGILAGVANINEDDGFS